MKNFSVATFNVHSWYDANFAGNYDRVKNLVKVRLKSRWLNQKQIFFFVATVSSFPLDRPVTKNQ